MKEGETDLEEVFGVHFAKMYETGQPKISDHEIDLGEVDESDLKFHFIIRANETKEKTYLPDSIKLAPKYPGENNFLRLRTFPAVVRFHQKRQDIDPHKFFLSELMMYYPFRDEKTDLHSDNEKLRAELYMRERENIRKVKALDMEHLEDVEEARFMVEEYLKNEERMETIAEDLDPENEQDIAECLIKEDEMHPDFEHLNPDGLDDPSKDSLKREKMFKPINVGCLVELQEQSKKMDFYQRFVLEISVKFARGIVKSLKLKNKKTIPSITDGAWWCW